MMNCMGFRMYSDDDDDDDDDNHAIVLLSPAYDLRLGELEQFFQ